MSASGELRAVTPAVARNAVVQAWGTPNATIGSVNEPREQEEHGHRFNEKWTYRIAASAPDQPAARVIYWLRYDFVAAYLITGDGVATPEDVAGALRHRRDRRFRPAGMRSAD
jgi:hypothetical protein